MLPSKPWRAAFAAAPPSPLPSFADGLSPLLHLASDPFLILPCQSTLSVRQSCRTGLLPTPFRAFRPLFALFARRHPEGGSWSWLRDRTAGYTSGTRRSTA